MSDEAAEPVQQFMSTSEAAKVLGCHRNTIRNYTLRGSLPSVRIGSHIFVSASHVRKLKEDVDRQGVAALRAAEHGVTLS